MKEIALTGLSGHVFADVLSALLKRNVTVNAMVNNPERLMLDDVDVTVSHLDVTNKEELEHMFEGYHDVVMTFHDDLEDHDANTFVLDNYVKMVNAARNAGVARLVIVGSPESEAFFMGDLRRHTDIDWVFISTEGDFADHTAEEIVAPRFHREKYVEE